ncbi:MAG: prohibitin family protein [Desulfobacterales bacterium]|nr:prohibitin family protein [Desulfobacterales bacterium]
MTTSIEKLTDNRSIKKKLFFFIIISGIITILCFLNDSYYLVEPGTVGVVTHFGAVQSEIMPEGLHFITPVRTKIISINVRIQKLEAEASASSKDLQIVTTRVALNFYLSKEKANLIFQNLGMEYKTSIIDPTIQESVKSTIARFNAEEVITKRPEVKLLIFNDIKNRLEQNNIVVTDFSIVDFSFSTEFNKAIEEKQIAEQRALRARNDLERIKTEAEQVKVRAKGEASAKLEIAKAEAKAQELLRKTLDPQIIKLRTVEKWDGVLPMFLGETSGTFIDVVRALEKKTAKKSNLKQ